MSQQINRKEVFEANEYLYFYEKDLTPQRLETEINFLIKELNINGNQNILDVPCGFGRHSIELAKLVNNVTGIDFSSEFLEMAFKNSNKLSLQNIEFVQQDMKDINYNQQFDIILNLFTSFGYFEDADNEKLIEKFAQALKPGGKLVIETINIFKLAKFPEIKETRERDGNSMIEDSIFDPIESKWKNHRKVVMNGESKDKYFEVRLYSFTELNTLLNKYGLKTIKICGDYKGNQYDTNSPRMIVISQKG